MLIRPHATSLLFAYVAYVIASNVATGDAHVHEAATGHAAADVGAADGSSGDGTVACACAGLIYLLALTIYRCNVLELRKY